MKDEKTKVSVTIDSSGLFLSLLSVSFIVLKLVGVIDWRWIWILAPIWIPIALAILGILIGLLIMGIASIWERMNV